MIDTNIKVKGAGRGRPKGSNSFVTIPMQKLNEVLTGVAQVPVSKKWAEMMGIRLEDSQSINIAAVSELANSSTSTESEGDLQMTIED